MRHTQNFGHAPGQDLGAQSPHADPAAALQLEAAFVDPWRQLLSRLLSLLLRRHQGPQLVEFLKALTATIEDKLLIVWDGPRAHRSRVVREYVESLDGRIVLERLSGYAPELNPVESSFGCAKRRELADLCADTIAEVKRYPSRRLKSVQRGRR